MNLEKIYSCVQVDSETIGLKQISGVDGKSIMVISFTATKRTILRLHYF